ncbi:MAG: thiamine pyrophosphate-dependent enzyme [Adlercreutzia sp.]|nr:thiamine pyrophosphate-dependent enzyme [Adlercreutzia sp.]
MKQLLMGNEAFAHAALEAGVNVVAGYPGTPSSEVVETVAKLHGQGVAQDVHVEWSTNEKAALEMLAGASYCGARVLYTCKQVGLNVASDALMSLNYVGVRGGCVLFVADDPGPISSQTEQDTRRFGSFAKVPVLDPCSPDQGVAMMKAAFELSERYDTPVIVRPTTRICHASTFFEVQEETHGRPLPADGFQKDPKWVIFPKRAYEAHGEIIRRLARMAWDFDFDPAFSRFNQVFEGGGAAEAAAASATVTGSDGAEVSENGLSAAAVARGASAASAAVAGSVVADGAFGAPTVGIVAGGVSVAYAREALGLIERAATAAGVAVPRYRFMAVGTPYPFPVETAAAFAAGLTDVIVFEELDSVLEEEMLKLAGARGLNLRVQGKLTGSANDRGENSAENIAGRLGRFFDRTSGTDGVAGLVDRAIAGGNGLTYDGPLPVRPPVLCAGCPHRGSFYAVKRALGKRPAVLTGDIGCYTLGNAQPLDAVDTCLCMGAGLTMAQGFAVAEPGKKAVAFIGDSTFFASGMTGVANAVYNGHDVTFAILDNATTAMTGSQPHPGTGVTLMGDKRRPIVIEEVLKGLGIECITFANPHSLEGATEAARQAIDFEGPSAVIFRAPCIQLKKPAAPVVINADTCTGCKKCITSIGCPGIGFDAARRGPASRERGQAFVDGSLCDGCGLCVQVCPFSAIENPNEAPVDLPLYGRVLEDEMNDFQQTEINGEPDETPGEALGQAEGLGFGGVAVARCIVRSDDPTGPIDGLPVSAPEGGCHD